MSENQNTPTPEADEEEVLTDKRVGMDKGDMADAIDHEEDQKFDHDDTSRYEDDVEKAMTDER